MKYDQFIGHVQNRARLGTTGEAVSATRATLQTLGQRLHGNGAKNLADQLPQEIGLYLTMNGNDDSFGVDEFLKRVAERESCELPESVYHARVVFSVLQEAVSEGAMDNVLAQLPQEYHSLITSGYEGNLDLNQN
ncbi:MAG: DUF2267 domain-containing protein [Chloroflexota bacterium]